MTRPLPELLDEQPPAALDSERDLICGALLLRRVNPDISIEPRHFYREENQALWQVMSDLDGEHGTFDMTMVLNAVAAADKPPGFDWAPYLVELFAGHTSPLTAPYHVAQIRQAYARRMIGHEAIELFRDSRNGGMTAQELRDRFDRLTELASDETAQIDVPLFTQMLTGGELMALDLKPRFLVRGVLVEGQPMIVGGRSKAMKTSIGIALAISLGSGTPFLGKFDSHKVNVGFWSGESGAATIRETAVRIAETAGVTVPECSVRWCFALPKLSTADHLDHLRRTIEEHELQVVVLDPLYQALLTAENAGQAGNLFAMGAVLQPITEWAMAAGITLVVLHHFRKSGQVDDENPCSLEELSQSGAAEWARQWILLQRRVPYQGDGQHLLWMRCGGSAGHSSLWGLTIDEGQLDPDTFTGRTWEVTVAPAGEARAEAEHERAARKAAEQERRDGEHCDRLLDVLRTVPEGDTARVLREVAGLNTTSFAKTISILIQEGRAARCQVVKTRGTYDGFKPIHK